MEAISQNHQDFAARIARIEKSMAASTQMLFVGVDEAYVMPRRERRVVPSGAAALFGNLMYPVSLVAAVALGAVSHSVGQVLRFHVQGLPDRSTNPDIETLVQIILGIAISIALGYVLRLSSRAFTTLKSGGVVLGVLFGHNAVHLWPHLFAGVTSEMWVNQMITQTEFYSLAWRGISFVF